MSQRTLNTWLLAGLVGAFAFMLAPAAAQAQACSGPYESTLDQHVAVGRAAVETSQDCSGCFFGICGLPAGCESTSSEYTATGSGEYLGSNGSAVVVLYEQGGDYSNTVCQVCESVEQSCGDGLDEDCDGATDCDDSDCASHASCGSSGDLEYLMLGPGTIQTVQGEVGYFGRGIAIGDGTWLGIAPVQLPQGAVIETLTCAANAEGTAELEYAVGYLIVDDWADDYGVVGEPLYIQPEDGETGLMVRTITMDPPFQVDNGLHSLSLGFDANANGTSMGTTENEVYIKGCRVGYTL